MPNEKRLRTNLVAGALSAGISNVDTTISSAGLADLGVVDATNHAAITLFSADANGRILTKEIVYVTAHTAGATTATVQRAQEGTAAQAWSSGATWAHTATTKDFDGSGGGSGLIGATVYKPASDTTANTTSATYVDADATNLAVAFTVPPSGKVLVRLTALGYNGTTGQGAYWNLREGTSDVAGSEAFLADTNLIRRVVHTALITGLTPGQAKTWKWGHRVGASGTTTLRYGTLGAAVMEVWAVNL
jgi:hypothetical protein